MIPDAGTTWLPLRYVSDVMAPDVSTITARDLTVNIINNY